MYKLLTALLGAMLSLWLYGAVAEPAPSSTNKPNVIFIVLDDIGQMDLSIYNDKAPATPNLDAIAKRGVYFKQALLSTSYCSASRAAFITGMNPSVAGAPGLHDPIPEGVKTLPYFLNQQGYYTAAVGKWHMGPASKQYFDDIIPSVDDSGAAGWLDVLAQRPKDKPFFFWLAPHDGHLDYTGWHPPHLRFDQEGRFLRPWVKKTWVDLWRYTLKLNDYFFEVRRIDSYIGKLFLALEREGILENTLIVIVSDNGPQQEAKGTLYDRGLLTPLIIHYPPLTAKRKQSGIDTLVSTLDVTPTIMDVVGAETPSQMQGYSLKDLIANEPKFVRNWIYAEKGNFEIRDYQRLIRTERYAYKRNYWNRNFCGNAKDYALVTSLNTIDLYSYEELYDLRADPLQQRNIIDEAPNDLLASFRSTMNVEVNKNSKNHQIPPLFFADCDDLLLESLAIFLYDIDVNPGWTRGEADDRKINSRL